MEWVFDGGRPCLDLVNTMRSRHEDGVELLTGPAPVTAGNVLAAKALREAIDRVLPPPEEPSKMDVELVNNARWPSIACLSAKKEYLTLAVPEEVTE